MRITARLLPLALLAALPVQADEHEARLQPQTVDYALMLPANLPHMLRVANDRADVLGLDPAQRRTLKELMAQAPTQVFARLTQAEKLEHEIADDILIGRKTLAEMEPSLERLAQFKRAATEAQIRTINRMQALLSAAQFRQLLELNGVAAERQAEQRK